jgi:hypothetical protein
MRGLLATLLVAGCAHARPIDIDANGLWWEAGVLYAADEAGGRIVAVRGGGAEPVVALAGVGGQVVRLADGTLVAPGLGGIAAIAPDGSARAVPGLTSARRRIGLAPAGPGHVFSAWFEKDVAGGISDVALAGGERDLVTGLGKPVGLAVSGGYLWVGDQKGDAVLRCPASACAGLERVAKLAAPDLLAPAPDGAVLAASRGGGVTLVCPDGRTRGIVAGTAATRGVAYDPGGRVFVVERAAKRSTLRVEPAALGDHPCAQPLDGGLR